MCWREERLECRVNSRDSRASPEDRTGDPPQDKVPIRAARAAADCSPSRSDSCLACVRTQGRWGRAPCGVAWRGLHRRGWTRRVAEAVLWASSVPDPCEREGVKHSGPQGCYLRWLVGVSGGGRLSSPYNTRPTYRPETTSERHRKASSTVAGGHPPARLGTRTGN